MQEPHRVTVVDFDISLGSLIKIMVKAAFAAIPALIIIVSIVSILILFWASALKHLPPSQ